MKPIIDREINKLPSLKQHTRYRLSTSGFHVEVTKLSTHLQQSSFLIHLDKVGLFTQNQYWILFQYQYCYILKPLVLAPIILKENVKYFAVEI